MTAKQEKILILIAEICRDMLNDERLEESVRVEYDNKVGLALNNEVKIEALDDLNCVEYFGYMFVVGKKNIKIYDENGEEFKVRHAGINLETLVLDINNIMMMIDDDNTDGKFIV